MGSYLSIDNNTSDTWQCKIGPDEAALEIAGIVVSVVAAAATVIGTAGTGTPVASAIVSSSLVSVFGVSAKALEATADAVSEGISIAGDVSSFGLDIANGINDNLIDQGYVSIKPGEKHQWGKMSLSLWQQGTCVRTIIKSANTVQTDTLYMRPIFSGATDNSNLDHQIQWWIDKWGVESSAVEGTTDAQSRRQKKEADFDEESEDVEDESYDSYDSYEQYAEEDDGETIYFYQNGTSTYGGSIH